MPRSGREPTSGRAVLSSWFVAHPGPMTQGIHHVAVRGADIAFLAHPAGGAQLELIAGLTDHHAGDGLVHHVAFGADDVAALFARLRAAGVPTLEDAPVTLANGRQLFSCRGPDGERAGQWGVRGSISGVHNEIGAYPGAALAFA